MPNIAKLTLELETVTPMFLGDASSRDAPTQLRVPSVRGVLRYWLRALLGGVLGDDPVTDIKSAEAQVFGSTRAASSVIVQLSSDPLQVTRLARRKLSPGQFYLFWSMLESGKVERGNSQKAKDAIVPRTSFSLVLTPRPGTTETTMALYQSAAALWLLVQLGGLGARSHRAAGGLRAVAPIASENFTSAQELPDFRINAQSVTEYAEWLGNSITTLRKQMANVTRPIRVPSRFDVIHPQVCKIWVLTGSQKWRTWGDALDEIGLRFRDYRGKQSDRLEIREWLSGRRKSPTIQRAAFGLPMQIQYKQGFPPPVVLQARRDEGKSVVNYDRRASPLSLQVRQLASGEFVGIAVFFNSEYLPRGSRLLAQNQKRKIEKETTPPTSLQIISDFITTEFHAQEVKFQ